MTSWFVLVRETKIAADCVKAKLVLKAFCVTAMTAKGGNEWREKNLLQTLRAAQLSAVCVWVETRQRYATYDTGQSHCGLPEVSSAHLAQRLKVFLAHAVRVRRQAAAAVLLPPLALCEHISAVTRKSHAVSFCHKNMLCVCFFRTDKMANPSSAAGLWGWRAAVHGRASLAVRTGWPTGLAA